MISKIKLFNGLAAIFASLIVGLVGIYLHAEFVEEPWLSYGNMPFPVVGKVMAGQPVVYSVIRCNSKSTRQTYQTTRNLQRMGAGQISTPLPPIDVSIEPGCNPAQIRMNVIPITTPPGFYMVHGKVPVRGLYKDHIVGWNSSIFEVVADPKEPAAMAINEMRVEAKP